METHAALEPGSLIDRRFRVERLLGRGGYGEVYLAHQLSMQRAVALKTLHTTLTTPTTLERFQNEARWACQLNHPNTVTYYDFGFDPEANLAYLVMEYLHGETLAERLKRLGPLSLDELTVILEQICGSLAEAHSVGIIHRDVKPENIMLIERAGRANYVKVIDFGIAKALEPLGPEGDEESQLTATGALLGSPHYMSPEQIRSGEIPIDRRADVYALGCLVFKALTGVPPFRGRSAMDIATRHLIEPPPHLSAVANGVHFPIALERLVLRALSKTPEERPTTALLFFEEYLEAVQDALVTPIEQLRQGAPPARPALRRERPTVIGGIKPLKEPLLVEVNLPAGARASAPPAAPLAALPASLAGEGAVHTLNLPALPARDAAAASPRARRGLLLASILLSLLIVVVGLAILAQRMRPAEEAPRVADASPAAGPTPQDPPSTSPPPQAPPPAPEASAPPASAEAPASAAPASAASARADAPTGAALRRGREPAAQGERASTREVLRRASAELPPAREPAPPATQPAPAAPRAVRVTLVARPWGRVAVGRASAENRLEVELKPGSHVVVITQYGREVLRRSVEIRADSPGVIVLDVPRPDAASP